MADDSDWESVGSFKDNDDDTAHLVIMGMPPEGIVSSENISSQPSVKDCSASASTTSFAFIEKVGAWNLKNDDSSSSLSSYVAIPNRNSSDASLSEGSLGSLISNFEVVSLASGKTVLNCKRCRCQYSLDTKICNVCYLALCANPCQDFDEEIALALQKQEEATAYNALKYKERKRENIRNKSSFAQAKFLAKEILSRLGNSLCTEGLKTFSEIDLTLLASGFIQVALEGHYIERISIGYKTSLESEWSQIRLNGFSNQGTVQINMDFDGAVKMSNEIKSSLPFDMGIKKESRPKPDLKGFGLKVEDNYNNARVSLHPIAEDIQKVYNSCKEITDMKFNACKRIWIVAIIEFNNERLQFSPITLIPGRQVLPLASFDPYSTLIKKDKVSHLANGLLQICEDFIYDSLLGDESPGKKKAKVDSPSNNSQIDWNLPQVNELSDKNFSEKEAEFQGDDEEEFAEEAKTYGNGDGDNHDFINGHVPSPKALPKPTKGNGGSEEEDGKSSEEEDDAFFAGFDKSSNNSQINSRLSLGSKLPNPSNVRSDLQVGDDADLKFDLIAVENGSDTRSTIMVKNIPYNYTQQILLSDFEKNGFSLDFFHLPIDRWESFIFGTPRHRGYAFVTFVNYLDILEFYKLYVGKRWAATESMKKCRISYARIQEKSAILRNIENQHQQHQQHQQHHSSGGGSAMPSLYYPDHLLHSPIKNVSNGPRGQPQRPSHHRSSSSVGMPPQHHMHHSGHPSMHAPPGPQGGGHMSVIDGFADGVADGMELGVGNGIDDGDADDSLDDVADGLLDGVPLRAVENATEGTDVDAELGTNDSVDDGADVGTDVGVNDGADIGTNEGANVSAKVGAGDGTGQVPHIALQVEETSSMAHFSSHSSGGQSQSSYLPKNLNGDWQSDNDTGHRRQMIQNIVQLLKQRDKNSSLEWLNRLPQMVKQLEVSLYRSAPSFEAYADTTTLKSRLQGLPLQFSEGNSDSKRPRSSTRTNSPYNRPSSTDHFGIKPSHGSGMPPVRSESGHFVSPMGVANPRAPSDYSKPKPSHTPSNHTPPHANGGSNLSSSAE